MAFIRRRWVHSTGGVSVCLYELVESVRQGSRVRQRFLLHLGLFESVEVIKRRLALLRGRRAPGLDARIAHLEDLLDRLARLLVERPRSRRRLWPDADDWLRGRGSG